jgi:hypothetical protein
MAEPSKLRVSDEERERVAEEMREHFALGRLDQEELDERVQAAYSARTGAELQAVRADLPQLPATPAQLKAELARRRGELRRRLLQQTGGSLGAFFICAVIWAASGATGFFWPIFVALAVLVPLLRNGWRLYGPAPELDRVEEELVRMESQHRRRHRGHRHRGARRDRW